jgi:hypothetical protein
MNVGSHGRKPIATTAFVAIHLRQSVVRHQRTACALRAIRNAAPRYWLYMVASPAKTYSQ